MGCQPQAAISSAEELGCFCLAGLSQNGLPPNPRLFMAGWWFGTMEFYDFPLSWE